MWWGGREIKNACRLQALISERKQKSKGMHPSIKKKINIFILKAFSIKICVAITIVED